MATFTRLLRLAAKIALDFVISPRRVDEAAEIFQGWVSGRDSASVELELAKARSEAQDPAELRLALSEAMADVGEAITSEQQEMVSLAVDMGLSALQNRDAEKPPTFEEFKSVLFPGGSKTFIIWLDLPAICEGGTGRYCHFNWDGESFRVRDYIGGKIYCPPDRTERGGGLQPVQLDMTAREVWQAGRGPIQCLDRFGLYFNKDKHKEWRQVLMLATKVAARR